MDNLKRALRTFLQAFTGVLVLQTGAILVDATKGTYVLDVRWLQRLAISAAVAGSIAVVAWGHNALEDATGAGILVPSDRVLGDKQLDAGIGAKKA